jgi:mRNA-degrading endonuclease RelE of RelBE toxin-antitoxin system
MPYRFTPGGEKDLLNLDRAIQIRVVKKLNFYFSQPNPLDFSDTLTNFPYGTYRFRIGKVRVIFIVEKNLATVTRVRFRGEAYE